MYKSTLFLATFVLSLFGEMAYAGVPSSGDAAAWIKRREAKPVDFSPNVTVRHTRSLEKRFHAERLTYFYPGLGACGHRHGDGDAVRHCLMSLLLSLLTVCLGYCFERTCTLFCASDLIFIQLVLLAMERWTTLWKVYYHSRQREDGGRCCVGLGL